MAVVSEKELLRTQWLQRFVAAQQADSWGQVVEAQEEYQRMAEMIAHKQGLPFVTSSEKKTMHRLVLCLSARVQVLNDTSGREGTITSADMKLLEPVFGALFSGAELDGFPIEQHKYTAARSVRPSVEGEIICVAAPGHGEHEDEMISADREAPHSDWQLSQAALNSVHGTVVSLRIDKIGLKDVETYIDPIMTIKVVDDKGVEMDSQDLAVAQVRRFQHVYFNQQLYLKVSLEEMQQRNAAIFYEFKHYKPKKKKVSTRCWSFMELNELKADEEIILEIYHKPTDLRKKKLQLHSEKQLYLHLFAHIWTK